MVLTLRKLIYLPKSRKGQHKGLEGPENMCIETIPTMAVPILDFKTQKGRHQNINKHRYGNF